MNLITITIRLLNYLKINYVLTGSSLYALIKHKDIFKYSKNVLINMYCNNYSY